MGQCMGTHYHYTDKCYAVQHNSRGIVGMANSGHNTNSSRSQFTITTPYICIDTGKVFKPYIYE